MKKTKIVATIGPATESVDVLSKLLQAGMDIMRLNFSHGDVDEHRARVENLRNASEKTGLRAAICQDLSGPKIRIGTFETESVTLEPGKTIRLTTDEIVGTAERVHINYPAFPREVAVENRVFLHDGRLKLRVVAIEGNDVICEIVIGGTIKGRRGVNLPDSNLSVSSLTEKDRKDLVFGIEHKVDFIALSFVRRPEDVQELRRLLDEGKSEAKIIAKIETPQAVEHLDAILELADAAMVARGDLAIEIPAEQVPMVQKRIIATCNNLGKPVITATQMLESMIHSPVATRAEVSDIANAILDGTDAVMLSEETTLGEHPLEAVQTMTRVAREVEAAYPERILSVSQSGIADSISRSVVRSAHDAGARAIVALTETGFTARMLSRHKPKVPILAISHTTTVCNQLQLSFGCLPIDVPHYETLEDVLDLVRTLCAEHELAQPGDKVVIAAGVPFHQRGTTNMLIVQTI